MSPAEMTPSAPDQMPGVSVVIPNEKATIAEAVHDARAAFRNWNGNVEVVVADNGSTDGTAALAQQASAHVV